MDIESIFAAAIAVDSASERAALLDHLCANDHDVRSQVEALLRHHDHPASFLERPEPSLMPIMDGESPSEQLGRQIGAYKLREQLAEGGMGVVYVAEQEVPVRRKVALKIVKPGMATKDVVARFEAERQALAMMDHPNIARVFDGGETDAGQPYFVMELVPGSPITDFCDDQKLSTRERVDLLRDVCRAVQHAHQKGVIHRDLKPSNILVAEIDGAARAKVIDFGVAKAVSEKLSDHSLYTNVSQMIGTPLYMSPEQAAVGVVDVDTRSDVYSLGVLLYELLTGQTPFDRESLRQAGFDEMRRIIREVEPSRPSALVSTLQGQVLSTTADRRRSDPRTLCHSLQGELDWIAMKALEKDRNRRYESASALAADLERYLNDQPVDASPPSTTYRLHKYASRHKAQLVTVAAVALVLVVAAVVSSSLAAWAVRERALVEQERSEAVMQHQRAESNLALSLQALDEVYLQLLEARLIEKPELDERDERFLDQALPLYQQLAEQRGDNPQTREAAARAYLRVGNIQNEFARYEEAEDAIRESVLAAQQLLTSFPSDPEYEQLYIEGQLQLADTARQSGRLDEAESILDQALKRSQRLSEQYPRRGDLGLQLAFGCSALADLLNVRAKPEEAVAQYERSVKLYRELVNSFPETQAYRRGLSTALNRFGDLLMNLGQEAEAEALEEMYSEVQNGGGDFSGEAARQDERTLADSRRLLAWRLRNNKRYQEAEKISRQALKMQERLVAEKPHVPDHRYATAKTLTDLGTILTQLGRLEEAEPQFRQALGSLEVLTEWWPGKRTYREQLALTYYRCGDLLARTERLEEAESAYRRQIALRKELADQIQALDPTAYVEAPADSQFILGDLLKAAGNDREATEQWRRALAHVSEASVDFKVRITTSGLYRLYLRGGGQASRNDSVNVRIVELADGPSGAICDWYLVSSQRSDGDFAMISWQGDAAFEKTGTTEPVLWHINHPGDYTIRFSNRDDGVALDAFVLQLASLSAPHGDGPEESPRTENGVFLESNGRVVAEAEHFASREAQRGRLDASLLRRWIVFTAEGAADAPWVNFRGPGYIQLQPDEGFVGNWFLRRAPLPQETFANWDVERYSQLIEARPDDDQYFLLRAQAYEKLEQSEEARADERRGLELLAAAMERDPDDPEPYRRRAKHFFDQKEYKNAVKDYEKLVGLLPGDRHAWFSLALSYGELQLPDKAIDAYTEVIRLDPERPNFYNNRGCSHGMKGELDRAIADFNEAIRLDPNEANAYGNRGKAHVLKGELDKAVADCTEAIRLNPEYAFAYDHRGVAYERKGELDKAIADYTEAIRLDPANHHFYSNRGSNYYRLKRYDKALADVNKAIELKPEHIEYYLYRGMTHGALGKHEEAIADCDKAITLGPNQPDGYNSLAWLLATCPDRSLRDPSRAVELASRAVELEPDNADFRGTLGTAHYRAGSWSLATEALKAAMQLRPEKDDSDGNSSDAFFLAMAHWKLGDRNEGRRWYDKAVKWMAENKSADEELLHFRAEAEALLESTSKEPKPEQSGGQSGDNEKDSSSPDQQ